MTSVTFFLLMLLLVADTTLSQSVYVKRIRCARFLLRTQEVFCKHLPIKDDTTGTQWMLIKWPWSPPVVRAQQVGMLISRCCSQRCTFDEVLGYC